MGLAVRGQVGPQTLADGAEQTIRLGRTSEVMVSELHGKFYEQSYRGAIFHAHGATAGGVISAAGVTAVTGMALYNPLNSSKNLVLIRTGIVPISGTFTVGEVGWAWSKGQNVTPTAVTNAAFITSSLLGGGLNPTGLAYSAATVATANTPLHVLFFSNATAATGTVAGPMVHDADGTVILTPGNVLTLFSSPVNTGLFGTSIVWEEVAI